MQKRQSSALNSLLELCGGTPMAGLSQLLSLNVSDNGIEYANISQHSDFLQFHDHRDG